MVSTMPKSVPEDRGGVRLLGHLLARHQAERPAGAHRLCGGEVEQLLAPVRLLVRDLYHSRRRIERPPAVRALRNQERVDAPVEGGDHDLARVARGEPGAEELTA